MSTLHGLLASFVDGLVGMLLAFEVSYVAGALGDIVLGLLQPKAWRVRLAHVVLLPLPSG
jgi:hypothetical protein